MRSFPAPFNALIVGATGGIGAAMMARLQGAPNLGQLVGLSRSTTPALDLTDEASIAAAAELVQARGPFHLIVDATGVLQGQGAFPEKSLRAITPESLAQAFALNAIGPALLIKHLHRLMPRRERAVFATLSARVGSIGDNRLGGWYGYRASKAALNMLLRTASVEIGRRSPQAICLALHPGTVRTSLSEPFVGKREVFTPDHAAGLLLDVIDNATDAHHGGFFAYDGQEIVW